ncbi:MAG: citramalate synthase [Dehalococcoidia bacterium CG2_30_46_19]|nr:MAG: citramalate synthase [Dehalococcoidia bacterium CG2_30_46_19]
MLVVQLYDTTLRDGAQQEGISFSAEDKLKIAQKLDELGIDFIEGGWPGSNPKDTQFFSRQQDLNLSHAVLVAFSSTRRPKCNTDEDANLRALLEAGTSVVTIVGKAWDKQVAQVLETTLEENLDMISDSINYLKLKGLRVFFDAEHFFDGYKTNPEYALEVIGHAAKAGAECVILCDTNGGTLPQQIVSAVKDARKTISVPLGIHAHNDAELAVANSLAAVEAGAVQIQGTMNGYGERCGNANLCSIIPNLKLKMGVDCISDEQLSKLSSISRYVSELANLPHSGSLPYVGASAFTHKGGLHVSGLTRWQDSYQHINPGIVGNQPNVIVSELSGKASIIYKAKQRGLPLPGDKEIQDVLRQVKLLESQGFQYDSAEASFDLLLHRVQPGYRPPFELVDFMVVVEKRRRFPTIGSQEEPLSEATIKVKVDDRIVHTAAEGNGPVNALDQALRKALVQFYPDLTVVELSDYKVRILEETAGTASQVRVLIDSTDGKEHWRTVGSSTNIIEASWLALADSIEYWLIKQGGKAKS